MARRWSCSSSLLPGERVARRQATGWATLSGAAALCQPSQRAGGISKCVDLAASGLGKREQQIGHRGMGIFVEGEVLVVPQAKLGATRYQERQVFR